MNKTEYENKYWQLYLKLENEMRVISDYIEICQNNYMVYSKELLKLFLQIGSELENVMKEATNLLIEECNILRFGPVLIEKYPDILQQKVILRGGEMELIPFKDWHPTFQDNNLLFWSDYNKVKHDRINNFSKANLKNTLYALAALYIVEMYRSNELFENDINEDVNYASYGNDIDCSMFKLDNWELKIRERNIEKKLPPYSIE